ncbi:hypothetical protein F4805DRAFT_23770 [Annulohypoxylon moriforme]|nr:hypothetical protein F4805DRAFT_23770 [Annulohypoxylon moriforme]
MGSKDPDVNSATDGRPKDRRRSKSERERDREKDKDKERVKGDRDSHHHHHHKSHRSKHKGSTDGDSHTSSHRRHRAKEEKEKDRDRRTSSMNDLVPELTRTSISGSRVSLPYPTFSKAHSKESVLGHEDVGPPAHHHEPLTPEATDLGSDSLKRSKSTEGSTSRRSPQKGDRPPSPPETDVSEEKKRRSKSAASKLRDEHESGSDRPRSRTSGVSRASSKRDDKSKLSIKSKASSQATTIQSPPTYPPPPPPPPLPPSLALHIVHDGNSNLSDNRTVGAQSTATPIAPKRTVSSRTSRVPSPIEIEDSPDSIQDSSPKTPTATPQFPPPQTFPDEKANSSIRFERRERPTPSATPATDFGPPPPPPPPPPLNIQEVPRIDYLLQNGGLIHPVPRNFLSVIPRQNGTRPSNPPLAGPETLFAPFFNLLDQYQSVIQRQGSVAVATGHKSVARRLLDRLEDVFSRDLPAEGCSCIMCERAPEEHRGLGWGEVLERVGGRVEMPTWPPFDLASLSSNAIENVADMPPRPASPVKLDPDIAEEFREHYLRQSKKVKSVVDRWMNNCAEAPAPAPSEIDDETLTFAILTNLDQEERPYFNALLSGSRELQPALRAPTPLRKPRSDFMVKAGLALQRIYRLPQTPRDAETAVFLVRYPLHHDLLVTITDINPQEWEILVSGRFDGFLWSGADADDLMTPIADNPLSRGTTPANGFSSPPPSRGPSVRHTPGFGASRSTTPFSGVYSRGVTPASFISLSSSTAPGHSRQPVSHDEEVEMAVLAEVEREIYQGMEALEDAFEKLHLRAEMVRNALRQRNNGLLMSQQHRRSGRIDVLPQLSGNSQGSERPPWAVGDEDGVASESDWGGDDFDLAPEDSASNISSSRHRRPKRRNERRTPAPIEEDDEENYA